MCKPILGDYPIGNVFHRDPKSNLHAPMQAAVKAFLKISKCIPIFFSECKGLFKIVMCYTGGYNC